MYLVLIHYADFLKYWTSGHTNETEIRNGYKLRWGKFFEKVSKKIEKDDDTG
jgi:hypothetical protein